jgi:peptidylprolyl isomerase
MYILWAILLSCPLFAYAESLAYYRGYTLYHDRLEKVQSDEELNQMIEGMKAAHRGLVISEEEISEKRKEIHNKAKEERLADANHFMERIVQQKDVVELIKGKLAYKVVNKGHGLSVQESDSPTVLYTVKTLKKGGEEVVFHKIDDPKMIFLKSTIPGFIHGVTGMQEGEKRIIYIHPDLAYGATESIVEPNSQIIFEVEIIKV